MPEGKTLQECFIVMPITEPDGYISGHFKHVYEDIIAPACEKSGFKPLRADEVKQTNLIHLDILQKLLDSPMCLCDLSTRNPNVLFELALRQAFDKPVALVQEMGTKPIFDISPLRYTEYRKERIYHEVLEDQNAIAESIKETYKAYQDGKGINSIVRLLSLGKPAKLAEPGEIDRQSDIQALILAEMEQMRGEFRSAMRAFQESRQERAQESRQERAQDTNLRLDDLYNRIRQLEGRLQDAEINDDELPGLSLDIEEARAYWGKITASLPQTEKERRISMGLDRRLERLESEFRIIQDKHYLAKITEIRKQRTITPPQSPE